MCFTVFIRKNGIYIYIFFKFNYPKLFNLSGKFSDVTSGDYGSNLTPRALKKKKKNYYEYH